MTAPHTHATRTQTTGPVLIVGTGLLGTSIGLALSAKDVPVLLTDISPSSAALAADYGAGSVLTDADTPELIVVAVPPEHTAGVVLQQLEAWPDAIVTDVASVKAPILERLHASGAALERYVGSHPMAGRERSGAMAARADLFVGRPWVVAPHATTAQSALLALEGLARDLDASIITMSPEDHDSAVALVSHVPQVISTLLAGLLVGQSPAAQLAGQGLRDTTRIAASQSAMWLQVFAMNAPAIHKLLVDYQAQLATFADALADLKRPGALTTIAEQFRAGNDGVMTIPGKHGEQEQFASVIVMVDDRPGELARLFHEIGDIGINIEDMRLEHSPGAQVGLAEIFVLPQTREHLVTELEHRTWRIAG